MKVFFSHAAEDKPLVEQVFLRMCQRSPDIKGWLDKYEILGGDDLIETVHAGIEPSNKFLIFLSQNSIDKPWVRTELRKALSDEINGIKPEFVIPIKIGHISKVVFCNIILCSITKLKICRISIFFDNKSSRYNDRF